MSTETRNVIVLTAGTGLSAILGLAYSLVIARKLGPGAYADFTAVVSLVFFLSLAMGPINTVVARFAAEYASRGRWGQVRTLGREINRRVNSYLGGALLVLALAVRPIADLLRFDSVIPILIGMLMVFTALRLNVYRGLLRGVQHYGDYSLSTILESLGRLLLGLLLLAFFANLAAGLLAYVLAQSLIMLLAWWQAGRIWQGHAPETVDGSVIRKFTMPVFVIAGVSAAFQNIDMLMVKRYFPEQEAGIYGAAFTLARGMGTIVTPLGVMMLPIITGLSATGQRVQGAIIRLTSYFLLMSAPPLVLFGIWPEALVGFLFGETYRPAGELVLTLALARVVGYVAGLLALAQLARNDFRFMWFTIPALVGEVVMLAFWNESLFVVVLVVGAAQLARLIGVSLTLMPAGRSNLREESP